ILRSLEVTACTSGNITIQEAVDRVRDSIREGESLTGPMRDSPIFPPMVVQMIGVGEETGELERMLVSIADFYETEVDTDVKALTSIIEPIVMIVMGVVIGCIVMSVFIPILEA